MGVIEWGFLEVFLALNVIRDSEKSLNILICAWSHSDEFNQLREGHGRLFIFPFLCRMAEAYWMIFFPGPVEQLILGRRHKDPL